MDIVIVTWNNIEYLKCQINSIRQNSIKDHTILVHINEGFDGTIRFLKHEGIPFTHTPTNAGLPLGVQLAAAMGDSDDMFLVDDDIYFMPNWDKDLELWKDKYDIPPDYLLCPLMIEPEGKNPLSLSPLNYGKHPIEFREVELVRDYKQLKTLRIPRYTDLGPFFLSRIMFNKIGGYSKEFSPAIGTDNDIAKKAWDTGYTDIVSVPTCLMYHFQCTSTNRIKNRSQVCVDRDIQFEKLYGCTVSEFQEDQLKKGQAWDKQ